MMRQRIARKSPYSADPDTRLLFSPLANVLIEDGRAIGERTNRAYDPFGLYHECKERRQTRLPPHLFFANLDDTDENAKVFLETYGPLMLRPIDNEKRVAESKLNLGWYLAVKEAKEKSEDPEAYYRKCFTIGPKFIGPAERRHEAELVSVNLGEFWTEQEEFLLVHRFLHSLRNRKSARELRRLFLAATRPQSRVSYSLGELTPRILGDLQLVLGVPSPPFKGKQDYAEDLGEVLREKIKRCGEKELETASYQFVSQRIDEQLEHVRPLFLPDASGSSTIRGIKYTWQSDTLLEAFYMMLFLDLSYGRRVVRCSGCGILFMDAKENIFFCSSRCETRTRVRKWWRKCGKEYRKRRRHQESIVRRQGRAKAKL